MEEGAARTDHDEKETPVSSSPDSGVCDLDTHSEDPNKPSSAEAVSSSPPKSQPHPGGRFRYTQSYDPFFFKYATDNRKLTLLKSLSQDSEYSLDTSLFDAEEFLQDMGFAGSSDPTIPDRFLPSLIQRLSKFPESEMESLHHRIIQSIGCFRRKEGKRRLFRNLSMGKDSSVDHYGKELLPCPSNNYPLLRSNTGPAEFPFNEATTSAFEVNNNSLKSGRLSSNDSGHHSMDSLKNEGEIPESPIAILVSSASVDQEEKDDQEDTDKGVQVSMSEDAEVLTDDESSYSVPTSETVQQTSDGEFMNTINEIQKLTDDISDDEGVPSTSKDSDFATEKAELDYQALDGGGNSSSDFKHVEVEDSLERNSPQVTDEVCNETTDMNSVTKPPLSESNSAPSPVKRPLRRISNAQSYNHLRHSKGFGSLEHQKKINENDDYLVLDVRDSTLFEPTPAYNETSKYNRNSNNPFENLESDNLSWRSEESHDLLNEPTSNFKSSSSEKLSDNIDSVPFSSNEKSLSSSLSSNVDTSPFFPSNIDFSKFSSTKTTAFDCKTEKETSSVTKPKFNRNDSQNDYSTTKTIQTTAFDSKTEKETGSVTMPKFTRNDSLTNFLSSMLDTSEGNYVLKTPVTPNFCAENQSKSDSEILQDNFSSEKFSIQFNFNKAQSTEALSKTQGILPFPQNSNSEVKGSSEKSPNRKRRVLRRMSSSLQCYDDDDNEYSNRLNVTTESFQFSSTNPFASPKLPLRETKSGQYDHNASHRIVHPCSSLPVMQFGSPHNVQNATGWSNNPFAYATQDSVQSNSDPEATKIYYRKKEKRNCKKRRFYSTPEPEIHSNPWIRSGTRELSKFNTCDVDMRRHQYFPDSGSNLDSHIYCNCFCKEADNSKLHFGKRYPEWNHCLQKEKVMSCTNCSSAGCHSFPSPHCRLSRNSTFSDLPMKGSFRQCMWSSTPDVRHGYYNSTNKDRRERTKLNSLRDVSMDKRGTLSAASSCCDVAHLPDDVFFSDKVPYCYPHSSHQPTNVLSNSSRKLKVRMPQRQNSMSIDDPEEHLYPNRKINPHRNLFQSSIPSKHDFLSRGGECSSSNTSSPTNGPSRKVSVVASPPNLSGVLQKKGLSDDILVPTQEKQLPFFDSQTNNSFTSGFQSPVPNNKNEALLERKIRIFSKFFANLGNLSKSIQDRHSDNEHKEKRDARFYDVIGTDKLRKSNAQSDFKAIPARKCSTPPPEFERRINLLKTRSSSLENSDAKSEVHGTYHRTAKKLECPLYENRVVLRTNPGVEGERRLYKPVQFTSSVSMHIDSAENEKEQDDHRKDDLNFMAEMSFNRDASSTKSDDNSRPSSQISFRVVSKELEDLQQSIQKAKAMRISASKELHLLQELLSGDDSAEGKSEVVKEKRLPTVYPAAYLRDSAFSSTEREEIQALKDLREKSQREVLEDTSFWQEELRKVKEETNRAWQEKLDRMEARLTSQEEDLHRLQLENENLHTNLEFQRLGSPVCHCKSENGQNGFGRIDSAFEDDEEYFSHKPSIPIPPTRQECDRLQERLLEEEQRADQLKLLLNQKLIEFNKLQLTLSKQTKEMIELEKSYVQLQCRLRKGTCKPVVARICSRTSPFNSKNLCPKPSPPATPQPNSVS